LLQAAKVAKAMSAHNHLSLLHARLPQTWLV
jgi:hypothetical protein